MASKQTLRDIERDTYEQPEADMPWAELSLVGLSRARSAIVTPAQAAGFDVRLFGAIAHGPADWRKRHKDDDETHYFAVRMVYLRLIGQRPDVVLGVDGFQVDWPGPIAKVKFAQWPWRRVSMAELSRLIKGVRESREIQGNGNHA